MSPELAEAKAEAPVTERIEETVSFEAVHVNDTLMTLNPDFEEIKDLCSERPLFFASRFRFEDDTAEEDREDIKNALESLKEPGSISLEDLEKELGL